MCTYFFGGVEKSSVALLFVDDETLELYRPGTNEGTREQLEEFVIPDN